MKKQIISIILATSAIFWSNDALSYKGPHDNPSAGMAQQNAQQKAANCAPATARLSMDFNDVRALIEQGGSMWQDRANSTPAYEVPKTELGNGPKAIYAGALWMGGTDVNGQLKLAALTFRSGNDFWPGPLSVNVGSGNYDPGVPVGDDAIRDFGAATIDSDQCLAYDKFFSIQKAEVIAYNTWWECTNGVIPSEDCIGVESPENDVLSRIYGWPAHGDVTRGQDYYLAPFYDYDGDGEYNPDNGDTPWYDDILGRDDIECGVDRRISLFGDETHWWVFNDTGNIHGESQGDPIGMEVRAQAFTFATADEVNRMTFYNYEMINRSTQTLTDTYFAQYVDPDLGNSADDYVGCDVSRGLGYCYNGDEYDEISGGPGGAVGYGDNPPAIGVDFFEGPYQDSDGIDNPGPYLMDNGQMYVPPIQNAIDSNGIVYGGIGLGYYDGIIDNERFGMRLFTYYTNGAAYPYNDPATAPEFYNFMQGNWANGSPMTFGGTGAGGTTLSSYMFPGDSDPLGWATGGVETGNWEEVSSGNPAGDRRFVQSAGPFTLTPGAVNNITVGIVYGRSYQGGLFASVEAMKRADTKAQALFDACFRILEPPYAPKLEIQELENKLVLSLTNPPSSNNANEGYYEEDKVNITDPTLDRFYTFEGYQIYQLANSSVSVSDVRDETKARLVAQCDIKNDIADIINFEFDEELGFSIGARMVDAANEGIQHTFLINEDIFAQGVRTLVNHKTYYYVALAYAHNEYKKYDPNDPGGLDGQKMPYISSRLGHDGSSIKAVAGIPHNPAPEAGGTTYLLDYGTGPQIKRLDGFGNGNRGLELTSGSKASIVQSGFMNNPVYDYGKGPINVKVVDPLNVVGGYFECLFRDYTATNTNAADTASWVINRYDVEGGTLLESVSSERTIDYNNEQIIPEWGVSVQISQEKYYLPDGGSGGTENWTTNLIGQTIRYSDSTKRWIAGIPDNDGFNPFNWIRSGTHVPVNPDDCRPDLPNYLDPCFYPDEVGIDNDKDWAKILGGTVAPHRLAGYQSSYMPMAYFNYGGVGSARGAASLTFLPSVDIVITSDKSKWTRCPVIELGREPSLNVGGAQPGQLRKSPSVDKNGNSDGTGTGMGWFPGYAIDIESGARLYMAFGENSFLISDNGADMKWNPTDRLVDGNGGFIMGGMHPVYVFSYANRSKYNYNFSYNYPAYIPSLAETPGGNELQNNFVDIEAGSSGMKRNVYGSISWVAYPTLMPGQSLMSTTATISLRVNKEYSDFSNITAPLGGPNNGKPMYSWNMDDLQTMKGDRQTLTSVLDIINVVPNPYYAYSQYETGRLDTRVKITNLPEVCTIKIYTVNGKLVRTFKKDSEITSVDWDLNNHAGIPIAGGVYLIHVDVPDVGEVVLKFFGGMRQVDLYGI